MKLQLEAVHVNDRVEQLVMVELAKVPANIAKIAMTLAIYEASKHGHSFGQAGLLSAAVVSRTGEELCRFEFTAEAGTETAMIFGELYRRNDEWKFRAVGQGYAAGLAGIARDFGVNVG